MPIDYEFMRCAGPCKRLFPRWVMFVYTCPICTLRQRNALHGRPILTPFSGNVARDMYDAAVQHLIDTRKVKAGEQFAPAAEGVKRG